MLGRVCGFFLALLYAFESTFMVSLSLSPKVKLLCLFFALCDIGLGTLGGNISAFFNSARFSIDANLFLLYFLHSNLFKTSFDTIFGLNRSLINFCGGSLITSNSYSDRCGNMTLLLILSILYFFRTFSSFCCKLVSTFDLLKVKLFLRDIY